ncbi:hypothetical protein Dimus_026721 [Dionaea muscipula]
MKTMLHKSFNPAKCKTALKLAMSRIKLLKNKKEVHLRQLKRDVAQLLQSGQEQTAMIRVEHVIREEKTMAAYDLIEIYCELVVARLPMVESQKNCPIDLKEAITSILFASPRCADIPELLDARKHFTAKYGKDFVSAAIELRPECGVNRTLVEKLSAMAPDANTKLKVLSAIANDHSIEWEPGSLKEKGPEPPESMLRATNNEKASMMHVEPPHYQAVSQLEKKNEIPPQFHDTVRSETGPAVNFVSPDNDNVRMPPPGDSYTDARCSAEAMRFSRSSNRDEDISSPARQNWNMEFKDATAAAQAAAESAERASMAARAAAELSSRDKKVMHTFTDSEAFSGLGGNDDRRVQDGWHGKLTPRKSLKKSSFGERSSSLQAKQRDADLQDKITVNAWEVGSGKEHSESKEHHTVRGKGDRESTHNSAVDTGNELKGPASVYHLESEDESAENPFYEGSTEVRNMWSSSDHQSGASPEEHGSFSNFKGPTYDETVYDPYEESVYMRNSEVGGQPSHSSFHYEVFYDEDTSHSGAFNGEDHGISGQWLSRIRNTNVPSVFVERETMQVEKETEVEGNTGLVFDESSSEDDESRAYLQPEHDMLASALSVTSPNREWSTHFSPGQNGSPEILETFKRSSVDSQAAEPQPVTYDDSDGTFSDIAETDELKTGKKSDSWTSNRESPSALRKGYSGSGELSIGRQSSKDILQKPSSNDLKPTQSLPHVSHLSPQPMITPEYENQSDEFSTDLNLGSLTGGLRNRGYRLPPYRVDRLSSTSGPRTDASFGATSLQSAASASHFGKPFSRKESAGVDKSSMEYIGSDSDTMTVILADKGSGDISEVYNMATDAYVDEASGLQSAASASHFGKPFNSKESAGVGKSSMEYIGSESDSMKVKLADKGSGDISKAYNMATDAYVDEASGLQAHAGYFDSGDGSSEEDMAKKTETGRGRPAIGISRRTRGSARSSSASMDTNSKVLYESSSTAVPKRELSSTSSHDTGILPVPTTTVSSWPSGRLQLPRTQEVKSTPAPREKMTLREETLLSSVKVKSSTNSRDVKSVDGASAAEIPSISTPSSVPPLREDSTKKAGHVHPKLPDYDVLAAHLQSLRTHR